MSASDLEYISSATSSNDESMNPLDSDSCPTNDGGVGLSNPQLSQGRRKMLDLVNKLQSTGVQVDIDLPQIAVIGSQSAGKSSLIESISGITLPRAAGTCTRCPTECRLARSDRPWQCVVSLRRTTGPDGQPLGKPIDEPFGKVITEKAEVEERIRRAQLAILNPDKPSNYFLEGDEFQGHESKLTFSQNCVVLHISGPGVADLSFCDLPGLIASQSSSRGGENDIELVESLVTSYTKKESCIILLTVACETDFENQGAHRLAKKHDPDGKRTIGVLTKPDRIPRGEDSRWLPFIRNEKEALENNWFCVKQLSSSDLKELKPNATWERARQMENDWFATKSPWCDLDPVYQKFLRTGNLVERLSTVLSDLIAKRLPQIQMELEKSILLTSNALHQLPKKPSDDPRSEISTLLHQFTSDVSQHVEGMPIRSKIPFSNISNEGNGRGLIQSINIAQDSFRISIRVTAPNFRPFEMKDGHKKHLQSASFLRHEEGDEFDDMSDHESNQVTESRKKRTKHRKIYIDEVLDVAHSSRTRELPGHYPFVVQTMFIKDIVEKWRGPAMHLCRTVTELVQEHLNDIVAKHFGHVGQGHLEHRVKFILHQHMKRCREQAENRVEWLLNLESSPFSLNTHYLSDYRAKFLAYYKAAREKYEKSDLMRSIEEYKQSPTSQTFSFRNTSGAASQQPTGIAKVLAALSEIGLWGIKAEDLANLLPPDSMAPALGIMADVRAYFQVAYKRFTDTVPLAIDYEVVRGAERDILKLLYTDLGVNGRDGLRICEELAQEGPQIADRRAELQKKLQRLEHASHELLSIGT